MHFVSAEQQEIAETFGSTTGDDVDKFELCDWTTGLHGLPILSECPNFFVGRIVERFGLGDHDGFLLEPEMVSSCGPVNAMSVRDVADMKPGHEP